MCSWPAALRLRYMVAAYWGERSPCPEHVFQQPHVTARALARDRPTITHDAAPCATNGRREPRVMIACCAGAPRLGLPLLATELAVTAAVRLRGVGVVLCLPPRRKHARRGCQMWASRVFRGRDGERVRRTVPDLVDDGPESRAHDRVRVTARSDALSVRLHTVVPRLRAARAATAMLRRRGERQGAIAWDVLSPK